MGLETPKSGRHDLTATTKQRLADLAGGWALPASPEPESDRLVTEPFRKSDPEPAPPKRPPPPPSPPEPPKRISTGTLPMSAVSGTMPVVPGAPSPSDAPPPPPAPPPVPREPTVDPSLPVVRARSVGTDEIDALLGGPMLRDPTLPPRPGPEPTVEAAGPAPTARPEPTATGDETRTVMELPQFAKGQPPSGVWGAMVYTWRAMRAGVDRRLTLRRLRADAAEKQKAREERLAELGELALTIPELVHAALDAARPHIGSLEDSIQAAERERGAIVAAVANEERQAAEALRSADEAARVIQARLGELEGKIRPLAADQKTQEKAAREAEQTLASATRKIDQLQDKRRVAETRGPEGAAEAADCSAKIAALHAEIEAAQKTLPQAQEALSRIMPELDRLRVEFEAARAELEANRKAASERADQRKETLKKLDERRAQVEQALGRAQADRKVALRDLGSKLDWDRIKHPELAPRYRALDELGGALTAIEYQIAELSREAGAVDKKAIAIAGTIVLGAFLLLSLLIWAIWLR